MLLRSTLCFLLLTVSQTVFADGKFSVMTGHYSFTSKSSTTNGSLSTFGVYNIEYQRQLIPTLELGFGYTLFYSKGFSGDMGFGPDINFIYFPITANGTMKSQNQDDTIVIELREEWRPFIGGGFSHRQFQSLNTSFAGFSVFAGTEYDRGGPASYKLEIRQSLLNGPSESTISQTDIFVGLSFPL